MRDLDVEAKVACSRSAETLAPFYPCKGFCLEGYYRLSFDYEINQVLAIG
jgi:hypothetical protein